MALGKIAFDAWLQLLRKRAGGSAFDRRTPRRNPPHNSQGSGRRPQFGHGVVVKFDNAPEYLVGCYHPSRQNTHTGKLTPQMMVDVFRKARKLL